LLLSERNDELKIDVMRANLQLDRYSDEKEIDNMTLTPRLCDDFDGSLVIEEMKSSKNRNPSIPRSPEKVLTINQSHIKSHDRRMASLEDARKQKRMEKTAEKRAN
jgi:hypothetical protein